MAQCALAICYAQGRGGLSQDDRKAERLFKLSADQGNPAAKAALRGRG
jgi:TPR repeat protein